VKALTKRKTDYDECDRHRSRKQSLVQPRQESVKETMPPVISVVIHGTSVAYSYSPSLQSYQDSLPIFPSHRPATSTQDESLFLPQGDYWTIGYQRHVVILKATRGLHDLALLLRNPGREFHVCELVGQVIGRPLVFGKGGRATDAWQDALLSDAGRAGQGRIQAPLG